MYRRLLPWFAVGGATLAGFILGTWLNVVHAQECTVEDPQVKTLSWTPPDGYEDGKAFGSDADHPLLDGYYIYWGKTEAWELPRIDVTTSTLTTWVLDCLEPDTTYHWGMASYVPKRSAGDTRNESMLREGPSFTTGASQVPPDPPDGLTVSSDLTVYTLVQSRDRIALVAVGTVPEGTECDEAQTVNGKYVVPKDAVIWAGTVRSEVVVAACD